MMPMVVCWFSGSGDTGAVNSGTETRSHLAAATFFFFFFFSPALPHSFVKAEAPETEL